VFPDQLACFENIVGDREIPDHPLVRQTIADCLDEAMDVSGLERLLSKLESGAIRVVARDLTAPSPLALEVLAARPYAFLDDAPLEERRAQAVMARRWLAPEAAAGVGELDPEAIARVRAEAWPDASNADELHDALMWLGFLSEDEVQRANWAGFLAKLAEENRAARIHGPGERLWIAAERLPHFKALWPQAKIEPAITAPASLAGEIWSREAALVEIVRGRLEGKGPITLDALAEPLGVESGELRSALAALEAEGFAMRGRFTPAAVAEEWCERRLLARIHRYTIKRLRAEIEPVSARDFLRFLMSWQRVTPEARMEGPDALLPIIEQLEGFEVPAGAWESEILPSRVAAYEPAWLDEQCFAGRIAWARLRPCERSERSERALAPAPLRTTPIALLTRRRLSVWTSLAAVGDRIEPSARAQAVVDYIREHGASFFEEILEGTGLLRAQAEDALAELVAIGLVTSDNFAGLRALLVPSSERRSTARHRRRAAPSMERAGRWALARHPRPAHAGSQTDLEAVEHAARTLLRRYGVVFMRLLEREASFIPPWRDLLRVYRTLEARGEIRGGRFVAGFAGEQFALPEAASMLREVRRRPPAGETISLSGADPLNLIGILTPGPRLPALTGNRVLYEDGLPVALHSGGEVTFLAHFDSGTAWAHRKALLRSAPLGAEAVHSSAGMNLRLARAVHSSDA
jgi:ATP-dependent Lhr-like helicase